MCLQKTPSPAWETAETTVIEQSSAVASAAFIDVKDRAQKHERLRPSNKAVSIAPRYLNLLLPRTSLSLAFLALPVP